MLRRTLFVFVLLFFLTAFTPFNQKKEEKADIVLKVEVQDELVTENQPFLAKIIIYHSENQKIDERSFKVDKQPLPVQFLSRGKQFSISQINGERKEMHNAVSCYIFEVKGSAEGLHTLPPVSVKVGDSFFETEAVSYFVNSPQISNSFNLISYLDTPAPLYPGQNFTATYRVIMSDDLEFVYENLPLLDLKNCQKKGKQKKRVFYQGNQRVVEYSQTYQTKTVGEYQIEPSFLEGRLFNEDFFGRRRYKKGVERAVSEGHTLQVQDFPAEGRPTTFNGAIGQFSMEVALDSSAQVCLGDKLKLKIKFKASEGLDTIHLSNLSQLEGFKDQFRFNDLPISTKNAADEKVFICELRPMKEDIVEIPPIEFSFYNPKKSAYSTISSYPIAITLLPMKQPFENIVEPIAKVENIEKVQQEALEGPQWIDEGKAALIEIKGVYPIDAKDTPKSHVNYHEFEIVAVLLVLILVQLVWKNFFSSQSKGKDSLFYLQLALKNKQHLQNYQLLLEKALLLRLREKKFTKETLSIDQLGFQGITGEVKIYIQELQQQLFSGQSTFDLEKSYSKARELYKKIGESL